MSLLEFNKKHKLIVLSLIVLFVAHYYLDLKSYFLKQNETQSVEQSIINSWKEYVRLPARKSNRNLQIAIGMNTNVDLILSGTSLFKKLNITDSSDFKNHGTINNLKQFKECFKYFFQKGSAAERSFEKLDDFQLVLQHTNDIKKQEEIGGNAALMAQNIASKFNIIDVVLVGPIGSKLKNLLNKRILIPFDSELYDDETHLILEYGINEEFENLNAPAANRFIISHDVKNSEMAMLNDFFNVTSSYKPDIIIISGLHLIESLNEHKRSERINSLIGHLKQNNLNNLVHLELASVGSVEFMQEILESNLFNHINSLGLNEQELFFSAHSLPGAPHANYYKEIKGQPELKKVIDILEWILNTFGQVNNRESKLTRVHFHCLIYHIIATIDNNEWSNTKQALVAGTKIASKQACGLEFDNTENEINLKDDVKLKLNHKVVSSEKISIKYDDNEEIEIDLAQPVVELKRGRIKFQMTPVLVCKNPKRTVGLGDSISSVGLVYSCNNC